MMVPATPETIPPTRASGRIPRMDDGIHDSGLEAIVELLETSVIGNRQSATYR